VWKQTNYNNSPPLSLELRQDVVELPPQSPGRRAHLGGLLLAARERLRLRLLGVVAPLLALGGGRVARGADLREGVALSPLLSFLRRGFTLRLGLGAGALLGLREVALRADVAVALAELLVAADELGVFVELALLLPAAGVVRLARQVVEVELAAARAHRHGALRRRHGVTARVASCRSLRERCGEALCRSPRAALR
ncbi:unnamed protein product, partial [Pelagomonas calceolata]